MFPGEFRISFLLSQMLFCGGQTFPARFPGDPITRCHSVCDVQPLWPWTHTRCLINSWPSTADWITAGAGPGFTLTISLCSGHTHAHTHKDKLCLHCFITHAYPVLDILISVFSMPRYAFCYSLFITTISLSEIHQHPPLSFTPNFLDSFSSSDRSLPPPQLHREKCQTHTVMLNYWCSTPQCIPTDTCERTIRILCVSQRDQRQRERGAVPLREAGRGGLCIHKRWVYSVAMLRHG